MNSRVHLGLTYFLKSNMFENPFFQLKIDPKVSQDELKVVLSKYEKRASLGVLKDPHGNIIETSQLNHYKNMLIQINERTKHRFFCLFKYSDISKCDLDEILEFLQSSNSSSIYESYHDYVLYGLYLLSMNGVSAENEHIWITLLHHYHKLLCELMSNFFQSYGSDMEEVVSSSNNYLFQIKQELVRCFSQSLVSLEGKPFNQETCASITKVLVSLKFDVEVILKEYVDSYITYIVKTIEHMNSIMSNLDTRDDHFDEEGNLLLCQEVFSLYESNLNPVYTTLKQNLQGASLQYFQECCDEPIGKLLKRIAVCFSWANKQEIYINLLEQIVKEKYFSENSLELNIIEKELHEAEQAPLISSLYKILECAQSIYNETTNQQESLSLNKKTRDQAYQNLERMYQKEFLVLYESYIKKYENDQEKRNNFENLRARCLYEIACASIALYKWRNANKYFTQASRYVHDHELRNSIVEFLTQIKHRNGNVFTKLIKGIVSLLYVLGIRGSIFLIAIIIGICSAIFSANGNNVPASSNENSSINQNNSTYKDLENKLNETKSQLTNIKEKIDDLNISMEEQKNEIDSMELDMKNGVNVDQNDYQSKIDSYNSGVEQNQSLVNEYNNLKDIYNGYVDSYNSSK